MCSWAVAVHCGWFGIGASTDVAGDIRVGERNGSRVA
jgi:hypothetical protein